MKNIHLIPTDKPSRIYLIKSTNKLGITSSHPFYMENFGSGTQNQHIYITSDEEIKEGDWFIALDGSNDIYKANKVWLVIIKENSNPLQKIILTTDQDLIKDDVQAIDDEFLEWFVKNPSCDRIDFVLINDIEPWYKIRFPKEETKQEPTDEEILEALKVFRKAPLIFVPNERMYSEEDLLSAFEAGMMFIGEDKGSFKEWFKQFKKTNNGK
jgi:hypothetical protein